MGEVIHCARRFLYALIVMKSKKTTWINQPPAVQCIGKNVVVSGIGIDEGNVESLLQGRHDLSRIALEQGNVGEVVLSHIPEKYVLVSGDGRVACFKEIHADEPPLRIFFRKTAGDNPAHRSDFQIIAASKVDIF